VSRAVRAPGQQFAIQPASPYGCHMQRSSQPCSPKPGGNVRHHTIPRSPRNDAEVLRCLSSTAEALLRVRRHASRAKN